MLLYIAENSLKDENCETKQNLKLRRGIFLCYCLQMLTLKIIRTSGDLGKIRNKPQSSTTL